MKRVWKWLKRLVLGTLALALLAVIAVILLLHTDWGREQVRKRVEAILQDQFPGGAKIGKLEGSIFGTLTIRDIELDGVDGKPLITVGELRLEPKLLPLLSKTVQVDAVVASDVVIDWRDQPSLAKAPSTGPKSPSAWSIDLRGILVHRGHVALAGKPLTLNGLEIDASLAIPAGGDVAVTASVHGRWLERGAPFAATVAFELQDGIPVVPNGSITLGGVSITATKVKGETGTIVVRGAADAIAKLEPRITLPGDVLLEITADEHRRIDIHGAVGPTPIEGSVQLDRAPFGARGTIGTHGVDLDTLTQGRVHGAGDAVVSFVTDGKQHHATVVVIPRIAGVPADTIVINVDGTNQGGHAIAFVAGPGDLHAIATADVTPTRLTRSSIHASIADPSRFAPVKGALRVSATASGPFATLAFAGTAAGRYVRFQEVSVSALDVAFSGHLAKPRPYGTAHIVATGIANAGAPFGNAIIDARDDPNGTIALAIHADPRRNVEVDLDATVTPRGNAIAIALGNHRINLPTMVWSGIGGRVDVLADRIVLSDLHTSAGQGGVDLTATYRKADKSLIASAGLTQIELEEIVPTIRGHLDGTATVEKRGAKWSGKADLTGLGLMSLTLPDPLPADAELHVVLDGRTLTATAKATNRGVGSAEVALELRGPSAPFDVAGWQRVPRADLHRLAFALHKITPGAVDPRASGTLDGQLELTPTDSKGTFEVRGVALPWGTADLDMTVVPAPGGELGVVAQAKLSEVGTIDMGARVALPGRLFDAPEWIALGRNALRGFSAQIDEVAVDPAMLARFHVDAPYHGNAMVQLAVGPGGTSTKFGVDLSGFGGGAIVKPIEVHAEVTLSPDGTSAFANASANNHELIRINGQVPVTFAQWVAGGWASAKTAEVTATLEIPSVSAVELLAIVGRTHLKGGAIDGQATIAGTLGTPTMTAKFQAHDVAVLASLGDRAPPELKQLIVEASWGGAAGAVEITGFEANGGRLNITASGSPRALGEAVARIQIGGLDLVPLAAFLPGPYVSLAGQVDGSLTVHSFEPATMKLGGTLAIKKGRIPISPTIGTLQNANLILTLLDRKVEVELDADLGVNHDPVRNLHLEATGDLAHIDAKARLHQVSPINAIQPVIDANVVASLDHGKQWTGTITVSDGVIKVPSRKGNKLLSSSTPDDLIFVDKPVPIAKTFIRPPPENPTIAVRVELRSTRVEVEDVARVTVSGQLDVELGGGGVGLLGAIDARGNADLFDRPYQIDHGSVSFDGTMDGLINVRLVHDFADLTLVADIGGRVSDPQIDLSSTPGTYTRGQLLGFLLGGEPGGDPNAQTQDAAVGAASSVASSILGSKVKKVVPFGLIDVLKCDAGTSASSASCTVGRWFTEKLFVSAKANLQARPDENRQEGEAQYYLRRSIILDLIGGSDSHHSLDMLWRIRW